MWISVRARQMKLSAARRDKIERYIARALRRERWQVASAVLYVSSARLGGGEKAKGARIVLWSPALGQIAVNEIDTTLRGAVTGAVRRVRQVVRRRLQKLQTQRRRLGRNRVRRFFATAESRLGTMPITEGDRG